MNPRLTEWVVPHAGNNHAPRLFKTVGVVALIAAILLMAVLAYIQRAALRGSDYLASVLPSVLIDLANADRSGVGAPSLTENPLLAEAARLKAADMAAKGYFAHTAPDGTTPWHWLDVAGYEYRAAGENLAVHFDDSSAVNAAWMASPTHRANLVNSEFTEIGIGTAVGIFEGKETVFVAQFFGRPAAPAVAEVSSPAPAAPIAAADTSVAAPVPSDITNEPVPAAPAAVTPAEERPTVSASSESPEPTPVETVTASSPIAAVSPVATEPATQVIAAFGDDRASDQVPHKKAPLPRKLATSPLSSFGTIIVLVASLVAIPLAFTTHHHLPHGRMAHIGAGVLILAVAAGTYFVFRAGAIASGKTSDAAAVIVLTDAA